jgi:hypothetical protein
MHTAQYDTKRTSLQYKRFAGKMIVYNESYLSRVRSTLLDHKRTCFVEKCNRALPFSLDTDVLSSHILSR